MTARPNLLRLCLREVKNDVWKYLKDITFGLYAVCGYLLNNQDRALRLTFAKRFTINESGIVETTSDWEP